MSHKIILTVIGLTILGRVGQFKRELLAVLYHHERIDGSGYPHGLRADSIPLEALIVAVADTYDVLTSDRPYRKACSVSDALDVVQTDSGVEMLQRLVEAFVADDFNEDGLNAIPAAAHARHGRRTLSRILGVHINRSQNAVLPELAIKRHGPRHLPEAYFSDFHQGLR